MARSLLQQAVSSSTAGTSLSAAEFKLSETEQAEWRAGKLENVAPEFKTPNNLFGDIDMGR